MAGTDIAIDLGSANFRLYVDGKGVVVDEPNVIAVDEDSNRVVAVGRRAYKMLGRTTGAPEVRPLRSSRTRNSSHQISCAHDR